MPEPAANPLAEQAGMVLRFSGVALWVPQADLETLEPLIDIRDGGDPPAIGWVDAGGTQVQVYCCGADLEPLPSLEGVRRMCAVLRANDQLIALTCDSIIPIEMNAVEYFPLPGCQLVARGPTMGLGVIEKEIIAISNAARITEWLTLHGASMTHRLAPVQHMGEITGYEDIAAHQGAADS